MSYVRLYPGTLSHNAANAYRLPITGSLQFSHRPSEELPAKPHSERRRQSRENFKKKNDEPRSARLAVVIAVVVCTVAGQVPPISCRHCREHRTASTDSCAIP